MRDRVIPFPIEADRPSSVLLTAGDGVKTWDAQVVIIFRVLEIRNFVVLYFLVFKGVDVFFMVQIPEPVFQLTVPELI